MHENNGVSTLIHCHLLCCSLTNSCPVIHHSAITAVSTALVFVTKRFRRQTTVHQLINLKAGNCSCHLYCIIALIAIDGNKVLSNDWCCTGTCGTRPDATLEPCGTPTWILRRNLPKPSVTFQNPIRTLHPAAPKPSGTFRNPIQFLHQKLDATAEPC